MGKHIPFYQFPPDSQSLQEAVSTFKGLETLSSGRQSKGCLTKPTPETALERQRGPAARALRWVVSAHYRLWRFCFVVRQYIPQSRGAFLTTQEASTPVVTFTAQCFMVIFTQSADCAATGILRYQWTQLSWCIYFGKTRYHVWKKKKAFSSLLFLFVTL